MQNYAELFSDSWAMLLVLLFFGGSIFVHEFGHFLAAKMRGLKVLRFSIGFGPKIFTHVGKDGCEYAVSLLPLGGYVALPQLADMGALEGGNDADRIKDLPKASCTDKIIVSAAGAFFNLLFAAVLAAIIWGVGITRSAALNSTVVGFVSDSISDIDGANIPSPAKAAGLKTGDKIIAIDGRAVKDFSQIIEYIAIGSGRSDDGKPQAEIEILRDGKKSTLKINPVLVRTNVSTGDEIRMIGISPAAPMKVGAVLKNSPAEKGGIKAGDIVAGIDGIKLYSNAQLADYLNSLEEGKSVALEILRDGAKMSLKATPKKVALTKPLAEISSPEATISFMVSNKSNPKSERGILKVFDVKKSADSTLEIGVGDILTAANDRPVSAIAELNTIFNGSPKNSRVKLSMMSPYSQMRDVFAPEGATSKIVAPQSRVMLGYLLENVIEVVHPSIYEQFEDSVVRTWNALSSLLNPQSDVGIGSLAGPVDIGRVIYKLSLTNFMMVISFAVLLNVNLAILNMLPIPVLDGGHILFAVVSKIRGKPLPPSFFAAVQGLFSILLLSLMCYVIYYGFMRWSGDNRQESADDAVSEYYIKNITF